MSALSATSENGTTNSMYNMLSAVSIPMCGALLSVAVFSPFKAVPVIGMTVVWAAGLVGCVIDSRKSA